MTEGRHGVFPELCRAAARARRVTACLPAAWLLCRGLSAVAGDMIWIENGQSRAPIILPAEADETVRAAADDLASYVERISGVRPETVLGAPDPVPERAVWVGYQPALKPLFPAIDFQFTHPEEILIAASERHLVIAGRDREPITIPPPITYRPMKVGEFGTANAVSTFIHDRLGVRWLWPGELGTDIPRRDRIAFEPFTFRFHPPIRSRRFRVEFGSGGTQGVAAAAVRYFCQNAHRLDGRSSHTLPRDHAYNDWSDLYREAHPEFFALQPDGTRARGRGAKLCVSNPGVARQWLDNMEALLRENPGVSSVGATPNDGGGWCVCEKCRSMDHPAASREVHGAHTERYVKYWNELARGLRERMPGRQTSLDVLAYAAYKKPPVETRLEDGLCISYAGHYPLTRDAEWQQMRADISGWAKAGAKSVGYRPNLFWYDGGFWGMPSVAMAKTLEIFALLKTVNCHVFEIDSVHMYCAAQAPQIYLMARLAYDPAGDGGAILRDFYERGFGPAADEVQAYYRFLEAAHAELVENPAWRVSSGARFEHVDLLRKVYTPERIDRARALLEQARERTQGAAPVYAERVAFVRAGLEFVALNMEAAGFMECVRLSQGGDRDAVQKAIEVCARRDALLASAPPFAIDVGHFQQRIVSPTSTNTRRMGDYLGPPRKEFLDAKASDPGRKLAVAQHWREIFSDRFDREELGDAWRVISGDWSIKDGRLTAFADGNDNYLLLERPLAALQRIEFVAAAIPSGWDGKSPEAVAGRVSDLSAFLHADAADPLAGYVLQFGARFNQANVLRRERRNVVTDGDGQRLRIVPGRFHTFVAEFDGRHVRLTVDDKVVLEYEEALALVGRGHDRLGLYSHTPMQVKSVRILTSEARAAEFHDDPDAD